MITNALILVFFAVVCFIFWLLTPSKPKEPRSQYTLPPLKKRASRDSDEEMREKLLSGYYGERLKKRAERVARSKPHTKEEFVRAMLGDDTEES